MKNAAARPGHASASARAVLIRGNLNQAAVGIAAIHRSERAARALFATGPSSIATPQALRCATTSSGRAEVRKDRSSLPAVSWSAVNHSTLSAPRGRTLIFWLPNTSEVRGVLPGPGSNTLTSMPRILRYHSVDRATSDTLMTRWSRALTLTDMPYPFVGLATPVSHWPHLTLFVTTHAAFGSIEPRLNRNGPGTESRPPRRVL